MKLSVEELLKPRYKVIADYPLSICAVGQIIKVNEEGDFVPVIQGGYWKTDISQYPHLFRKLEWWEDRKEDEMPEYVKTTYDDKIYRVASGIGGAHTAMVRFEKGKYGKGTIGPIGLSNLLPATEAEYNNQNIKQ